MILSTFEINKIITFKKKINMNALIAGWQTQVPDKGRASSFVTIMNKLWKLWLMNNDN